MQTNDHQIRDYDIVLDAEFGRSGTPERAKAIEEAYAFYSGQILHTARKAAGVTQSELAERINENWKNGLMLLNLPESEEFSTLARALGILFASGCNVLKFYRLRARLGKGEGDPKALLGEMRKIVLAEIENSSSG